MHRQNYEINICFVQQPLQSAVYTFKKKIKEQKKADLEAKERFRVRFALRFTPFKL